MKECCRCKKSKPLSDFNKRKGSKDGLQYACKVCTRKQFKNHYEKNSSVIKEQTQERKYKMRKRFNEYKATQQCKYCSENESVCLDFHHMDESKKDFNLSEILILGYSWKRIQEEIDKCICVCSNCHRKLHAGLL